MTLDQKLETAVLITLWIEFFYDLLWNNREARLKRRKREKAKKASEMAKPNISSLTNGNINESV